MDRMTNTVRNPDMVSLNVVVVNYKPCLVIPFVGTPPPVKVCHLILHICISAFHRPNVIS